MAEFGTISLRHWRLSRVPFVGYLCIVALFLGLVAIADVVPFEYALVLRYAFSGAVLSLLALPVVVSMRLHDMGRSVLWAVLPMIAMLLLISGLLSTLAAISGTPGATDQTAQERALELFSFAGLIMLGLLTLYCLFAPSQSAAHPNEATQ